MELTTFEAGHFIGFPLRVDPGSTRGGEFLWAHQPPQALFDQLRADVLNNTLPQVSWIVAPEALTEHPQWPAGYGAWYTAHVLDALTSNPDVW